MKESRNYGIDLLRVLSMFSVILLHSLGQGGIVYRAAPGTIQYNVGWALEIVCSCAVDIFALISGYVSYTGQKKSVNYSNLVIIWLQVVFLGAAATILGRIMIPEAVTKYDLLVSLFPVSNGLYWYLTAYMGLFAVMPLLNVAILRSSESLLRKEFVVVFLVFSIYNTFTNRFTLNKGYCFAWICIVYMLGAIIKKCRLGENLKNSRILLGIIFLYIITWLWKIGDVHFQVMNITVKNTVLTGPYTSPTLLGASVLYLILFSRIEIKGNGKKVVAFFASSAFAAYILNTHPFIWKYIITDRLKDYLNRPIISLVAAVFLFSLGFFIICILIDKIRICVFKKLRMRELSGKVVCRIQIAVNRIAQRL